MSKQIITDNQPTEVKLYFTAPGQNVKQLAVTP